MMTIHFRPLALLLVLGGCAEQSPDQTTKSPPVAGTELSDAAWTQALVEHRDEINEEFLPLIREKLAERLDLGSQAGKDQKDAEKKIRCVEKGVEILEADWGGTDFSEQWAGLP